MHGGKGKEREGSLVKREAIGGTTEARRPWRPTESRQKKRKNMQNRDGDIHPRPEPLFRSFSFLSATIRIVGVLTVRVPENAA